MKIEATYKDIWKISYPIMIGSMAQTIVGITDTAFLARVGEVELGASAIGGVFYFVLVMMGMALGIGSQIMMSRRAGENNPGAIGKIFNHSLVLLLMLATLVFTCVILFAPLFFTYIIKSPDILSGAVVFLKNRIWGIFFIMATVAFRSFYVGISQTRIITYSAIVMSVLNVLLDYLLIFGHYGFPKMGISGAALSSAISEAVAFIYLLIYTWFKDDIKSFMLFRFHNMKRKMFEDIVRLSSPIVMQNFISMGAWFAFFIFIERLGEHNLAISNIVRSNYMILMTPIWGFSSAANSMVSNLIGQKKPEEVMGLLKKISKLSFAFVFILVSLNVIFAKGILSITTSDPVLINDSLMSYYIVCFATLVFSVSMILFSGVLGTGATKEAMLLEISNIIIYLVFVYVCALVLQTSVEVVWFAEVLYWTMMGIFSYYYLMSKRWKIITI